YGGRGPGRVESAASDPELLARSWDHSRRRHGSGLSADPRIPVQRSAGLDPAPHMTPALLPAGRGSLPASRHEPLAPDLLRRRLESATLAVLTALPIPPSQRFFMTRSPARLSACLMSSLVLALAAGATAVAAPVAEAAASSPT